MRENSGQRWTYMDTFSIYANRTSVLEQEVQIALLALPPHILRSEHRMQTRHSDRKSPLIDALLCLAVETILPGVLTGVLPALLAVWRLQADGQPGLVDQIGHAAQMLRLFQTAQIRILFAERCQPFFQPDIVGVDAGSAFSLVEQDDGFFLNLRQSRHCQPPCCRPRCDSK